MECEGQGQGQNFSHASGGRSWTDFFELHDSCAPSAPKRKTKGVDYARVPNPTPPLTYPANTSITCDRKVCLFGHRTVFSRETVRVSVWTSQSHDAGA